MQRFDQADIVREARRWVDTPFRHRGQRLGIGADCWGVVRGVGDALGVLNVPPELEQELKTYRRGPTPTFIGRVLASVLRPCNLPKDWPITDGLVAWIEWREGLPMHLAITATFKERPTLIHATRDIGRCVEHGFTDDWRRRVHSYWRFPGVTYG